MIDEKLCHKLTFLAEQNDRWKRHKQKEDKKYFRIALFYSLFFAPGLGLMIGLSAGLFAGFIVAFVLVLVFFFVWFLITLL